MLASFQNKYTQNACLFRRKTRYTDDNGSTPCDEGRRVIYKEIVRHTGSKQRLLEQFKNLGNNSAQQQQGSVVIVVYVRAPAPTNSAVNTFTQRIMCSL